MPGIPRSPSGGTAFTCLLERVEMERDGFCHSIVKTPLSSGSKDLDPRTTLKPARPEAGSPKPGAYSRRAGGAAGGVEGAAPPAGAAGGSSLRHAPWLLFISASVVPPQQYTVHLSGAL